MRKLKLVEVENTDSGIILIDSEPYTDHIDADHDDKHGPMRLGVRVMYCEHYDRDWAKEGKYHVSVQAVAPEKFPDAALKSICDSYGIEVAEYRGWDATEQARFLIEAGHGATLWQEHGNNLTALTREARKELRTVKSFTFGFAMDRAQNAVGATGWQWVLGDFHGKIAV